MPALWTAILQNPWWKERSLASFSLLGSLGRYQDQMQAWQQLLQRKLEPTDDEVKYVKAQIRPLPRFVVDLPDDVVQPFTDKLCKAVRNFWSFAGLPFAKVSWTLSWWETC